MVIAKEIIDSKNNGGAANAQKQGKPHGDAFKQLQDWTITLILVVIAIICGCVACSQV